MYKQSIITQPPFTINFCTNSYLCDACGIAMVVDNTMYTTVHLQSGRGESIHVKRLSRIMQFKVIAKIRPDLDKVIFGDLNDDESLDEYFTKYVNIPGKTYTSIGPKTSKVGNSRLGTEQCVKMNCNSADRVKLPLDRIMFCKENYTARRSTETKAKFKTESDIRSFQFLDLSDHICYVCDR